MVPMQNTKGQTLSDLAQSRREAQRQENAAIQAPTFDPLPLVMTPELLDEIERVRAQGVEVSPRTLRVAENVTLILPLHGDLDRLREELRGARKLGTTGRGIGPAYEDKVARRAIRLCDLADEATLDWKEIGLVSVMP